MVDASLKMITCTAPINIALLKYWGKRDSQLNLPANDSISVTLCQDQLCTKTTVALSRKFDADRMWLNGTEVTTQNPRLQSCLKEIRRKSRKRGASEECNTTEKSHMSEHVHICSMNNFPTAAGLASSAAGYACLVYALAKIYGLDGDISGIARQGSGSACRSVLGGFVHWMMGKEADGSDSVAAQISPHIHWPELRVLICVVSGEKKSIGSSSGMQETMKTSELMHHRMTNVAPSRSKSLGNAILDKNFDTLATEMMKDSNQFHAVCLDTFPPIFYMNDTSRDIIKLVHTYNEYSGKIKVGYTFDAGPNACLFTLEEHVPELYQLICHCFPSSQPDKFLTGIEIPDATLSKELKAAISLSDTYGRIQYLIHTKVGDGPRILHNADDHLLGKNGLPHI